MRKIIVSLAAAGVLVAGAFVATSVASGPADAQTADTETTSPRAEARQEVMAEVLSGLVADGTLTQAQADAVSAAFESKAEEIRAEREARREERKAERELIQGFLEDDVISSDELSQLSDDHPLNDPDGPFADAAADGQITREELQEIREERGPRRGHRGLGSGADGASAEDASTPNA